MGTVWQKIELDPELDPWDKQPRESDKRYHQFSLYRDYGRGRTVKKTLAELELKNYRELRMVAGAFRWSERAHAWDQDRDRQHQEVWLDERRKAAENDAKLLNAALGKVAGRLNSMKAEDMTVADMVRLFDVVLRNRRALFGDPSSTVAVTGPGGDPLTIYHAEFAQMPAEQRRVALLELASQVQRRITAASGVEDDDDAGQPR